MANQVSNVINSMRLKRLQKQLAVNRLSDQMRTVQMKHYKQNS